MPCFKHLSILKISLLLLWVLSIYVTVQVGDDKLNEHII